MSKCQITDVESICKRNHYFNYLEKINDLKLLIMKLTIENHPNRNDIVNKDKETLNLRRRYTLMAIETWEGAPDTHESKEYNIDYFKKELEIIEKELEKLQNKTI
jgi:hypothetical protein